MSKPAARVGDMTAHAAPAAPGVGSPNVFIGGMPAWRAMEDLCVCSMSPGNHGTESGLLGSTTVFINGRMAMRVGDILQGAGPPNTFVLGAPTVMIGDPGFGMAKQANREGFARAMLDLFDEWEKLDQQQRIAKLQKALHAALPPGMPPLEITPVKLDDPNTLGEMNFESWRVDLNRDLLKGKMTKERMGELSNTIFHEGRHGEQWFHAAQNQAAEGAPAKAISKRMGIRLTIADSAVSQPAPRGGSEGEVGRAVYTSVYGERAAHRDAVLTDLESPKPQDGTYDQYRALPEEEDAWRQGDAVEADYNRLGKRP